MNHRLRFLTDQQFDLQLPGRARLEQVLVRAGDEIEAQVRPYVRESDDGPVELADLYLGEGTLLAVRMAYFSFA